ncbi:unnamed protein product [Caenorhabditis sp. 36 PRJEB53466]|nr:unnamed protein product [Caenorhabditis sp. 36 PRJEB53466]
MISSSSTSRNITSPDSEDHVVLARNIKSRNDNWINFVNKSNNYQEQNGRFISTHHVTAGTLCKFFILKKNIIVIVKTKTGAMPVKLEVVGPELLQAREMDNTKEVNSLTTINFDDIIKDPFQVERELKHLPNKYRINFLSPDFYKVRDLHEAAKFLDMEVWSVIKEGDIFEYQLPEFPQSVSLAKVLKNHRGLLLIQFGNEQRWVHMFDPLNHSVGWVQKQATHDHWKPFAQDVQYVEGYSADYVASIADKIVPSFVFRNNTMHKHRLPVNTMLCVADEKFNSFWYAHVVEASVNKEFFFFLKLGKKYIKDTRTGNPVFFHIYDPRIFSPSILLEAGIQIQLDESIPCGRNESKILAYAKMLMKQGPIAGAIVDEIGSHGLFCVKYLEKREISQEAALENHENLRFVEIMRTSPSGSQMCAAEVKGFNKWMMRMRVEDEEDDIYMHVFDPKIFHVGSALDMGIGIQFNEREFIKNIQRKSLPMDIMNKFFSLLYGFL